MCDIFIQLIIHWGDADSSVAVLTLQNLGVDSGYSDSGYCVKYIGYCCTHFQKNLLVGELADTASITSSSACIFVCDGLWWTGGEWISEYT